MKKIICLALLAGLFLFANSCHDDEINQDENLTLKSAQIKEKEAVSEVKSWFENNAELNAFELLKWKDEIKWQKAKVMEINDSLVVEIPIKLKGKYKVMDNNDLKINVEHRLLFIKEKGNITSYMEYFISKKDLDYLMDSEKVNYSKKGKYFEGQIVLENSKKEFKVIHNLEVSYDCEELKLKSAEPISCIGMYELFSDGSRTLLYIIGCTYSSGNGSEGGSTGGGGYISPTPQTCGCNLCPICHKCLVLLKSIPIPGEGGTTTGPILCGVCAGHPLPAPAPLPAPDYPIISIQEYLKCINAGMSATITIYVDQPVPNSSSPVSLGDQTVGHAFIGISQGGNYSTFGFYPKTGAKLSAKADISTLGNDSYKAYDVSITKSVTVSELQAVLSLANNPPSIYNLDTYNCTDFAIAIGSLCGISLPDTYSSWPGGGGSCPAALGQDIRNMTLTSGMSRNTSGGTPPSNVRNCQ
jgi:hypothetical protein